ncbi:DUF3089 domain-containing protein [Halobacillus fulvus]|nr:DUF3089 domain-containing protein [Halobacillus fulvus]
MSNYFQDFITTQKQAISLVQNEQYEESLSLLESAKAKFPDRLDRIGHWKAGIFMLEGKEKEALSELNEVLDQKLWWNPAILMNDEELKPLQDSQEFTEIIKRCTERYEKEKEGMDSILQVKGNPQADTAICSLHWKGSNAKDYALQWSDPDILSKYLLGFVQSSQLFSFNSYTWDEWDIAEKDVTRHFHEFNKSYNLEKKEIILSGSSQGGKVAVELLLKNNHLGCKGFLALVPSFTGTDDMKKILEDNIHKNVRGCVITGDQDPFYEQTVHVVNLLKERGVPCKLIVNKGMGHELPNDLSDQLNEAVDFIVNKEAAF